MIDDNIIHGSATQMVQYATFPTILADLVEKLVYRPGWKFSLEDIIRDPSLTHGSAAGGLTFVGLSGSWDFPDPGPASYLGMMDAYAADTPRPVYFYFPVPAATYDKRSWRRWLFDRLCDVERHETMEHFQIDGERPYSPSHGPGNDPYVVRDTDTALDKVTSFRGEVKSVERTASIIDSPMASL